MRSAGRPRSGGASCVRTTPTFFTSLGTVHCAPAKAETCGTHPLGGHRQAVRRRLGGGGLWRDAGQVAAERGVVDAVVDGQERPHTRAPSRARGHLQVLTSYHLCPMRSPVDHSAQSLSSLIFVGTLVCRWQSCSCSTLATTCSLGAPPSSLKPPVRSFAGVVDECRGAQCRM